VAAAGWPASLIPGSETDHKTVQQRLLPSLLGYESLAYLAANQLLIAPRPGLRTLRTNRETTHEGFYAGVLSDHPGTPPLTKHQVTALRARLDL
jgi:hypothetical protein